MYDPFEMPVGDEQLGDNSINAHRAFVDNKSYRILSESLRFATTFYSRELEIEDSAGELYYLRLRHDGRWEIERYDNIRGTNKWVPSYEVTLGVKVDISEYDDAM